MLRCSSLNSIRYKYCTLFNRTMIYYSKCKKNQVQNIKKRYKIVITIKYSYKLAKSIKSISKNQKKILQIKKIVYNIKSKIKAPQKSENT